MFKKPQLKWFICLLFVLWYENCQLRFIVPISHFEQNVSGFLPRTLQSVAKNAHNDLTNLVGQSLMTCVSKNDTHPVIAHIHDWNQIFGRIKSKINFFVSS